MKQLTIVALALASLALAGCGQQDTGKVLYSSPSPQQQVQQIQGNNAMPPQAKAAALAQLQAHQNNVGRGAGQGK